MAAQDGRRGTLTTVISPFTITRMILDSLSPNGYVDWLSLRWTPLDGHLVRSVKLHRTTRYYVWYPDYW